MRIRRLEITGFGPYKDRQIVDFDDFAGDGLFLITGKTGAGKSSILDAICFALYGTIPRFEGTQQSLRSDHCEADDPTSVVLVFTVDGTDYRVTRSPEYDRPKKHGAGTTTQKPTALLERQAGDGWIGVAARPVDVGTEIAVIVALTKEQFLQVILLAQNRFQDFLLARNDDRQRVLRSLFGTRRFLGVEVALVDRRKRLDERIGDAHDALAQEAARAATLLELDEMPAEATGATTTWFDDALDSLTMKRDAAQVLAATADAALTAADEHLRALEEVDRLQSRRTSALAELAGLAASGVARAGDRDRLSAARLAAEAWPYVEAARQADAALAGAARDHDAARESYLDHESTGVIPNPGDLPALIDESSRQLGHLEGALAAELTLPALGIEIDTLAARVAELASGVVSLSDAAAELPARIGELTTELAEVRATAGTVSEAAQRVARLEAEAAALAEAAELGPECEAARLAEVTASAAHTGATRAIQELLERRLAGHAGELAAALRDGDPCGVCGSTVHPLPATSGGAPVTDAHLDLARADAEIARALADDTSQRRRELETRLADALGRGGAGSAGDLAGRTAGVTVGDTTGERAGEEAGDTAGRLAGELEAARRLLVRATDAAALVTPASNRLDAARTELSGAESAITAARAAHTAVADELLQASTRRSAVMERVDESRGGFPTIGDRVDELRRHVAVTQALAGAASTLESRTASAVAARAALDDHLEGLGLADADAVAAARLEAAAIAALENDLRRADDLAAAAAATLADAAVAAAPAAPVDTVTAIAAVAIARSERDTALSTHRSLVGRVDQLARVVEAAARVGAASASLLEEFRQLRELSSAVEGNEPNDKRMRLETYVLAARLEEIVAAANVRLRTMTGGRYTLEHDDALQFRRVRSGLGLAIRDEHSGRARATHSLSGGETFLASLALALGLAEVVTNKAGGIRLDTLFIDEGFGSLDPETLEIAMGTLDSLRSGGRTIGLISHVDAMKEQIPAKLHIWVGDRGHSTIEGSYAPV